MNGGGGGGGGSTIHDDEQSHSSLSRQRTSPGGIIGASGMHAANALWRLWRQVYACASLQQRLFMQGA
jgi:hypothetical protein